MGKKANHEVRKVRNQPNPQSPLLQKTKLREPIDTLSVPYTSGFRHDSDQGSPIVFQPRCTEGPEAYSGFRTRGNLVWSLRDWCGVSAKRPEHILPSRTTKQHSPNTQRKKYSLKTDTPSSVATQHGTSLKIFSYENLKTAVHYPT